MLFQPMEFFLNSNNFEERFLLISDEIIPLIKPWYYVSDHGNMYSYNKQRF